MQMPPASRTLARFILRFAALMALTLAVLASVSVSASKFSADRLSAPADATAADTAEAMNSRRYPLIDMPGER